MLCVLLPIFVVPHSLFDVSFAYQLSWSLCLVPTIFCVMSVISLRVFLVCIFGLVLICPCPCLVCFVFSFASPCLVRLILFTCISYFPDVSSLPNYLTWVFKPSVFFSSMSHSPFMHTAWRASFLLVSTIKLPLWVHPLSL